MRIARGKVVAGKIVVEGESLEEGTLVTVLAPDPDQPFEVTADQEALLVASIEEAERGSTVAGATLLRDLGSRS